MTSEVTQCPPSLLQKTDSLLQYTKAGIPSSVECYGKRSALSTTFTDPRTMRCCFDKANKGLILDHVLANGFNTYRWVENAYFHSWLSSYVMWSLNFSILHMTISVCLIVQIVFSNSKEHSIERNFLLLSCVILIKKNYNNYKFYCHYCPLNRITSLKWVWLRWF